MAKHEITIHENTSATASVAPYLGKYAEKDTIDLDRLAEEMAIESGLPAIQTRAIIEGEFEEMVALEKESLVRANFDGFSVTAAITGSFPTSDAAFDPDRNKFVLAIRLADSLRLALVNVTPTIVADIDTKRVEISEVSDITTPRPYGIIHGRSQFLVSGYNLCLDDVGADIYIEDKRGTRYEVVVDEALDPQKIKAHTLSLLEPGDYKVVVKSRGGDTDGGLQTRFKRVKYLSIDGASPVVNSITSVGEGIETDTIIKGEAFTISGANFGTDDDDSTITALLVSGGGFHATIVPSSVTPSLLRFSWPGALDELSEGIDIVVTVTRTVDGRALTSNAHSARIAAS